MTTTHDKARMAYDGEDGNGLYNGTKENLS